MRRWPVWTPPLLLAAALTAWHPVGGTASTEAAAPVAVRFVEYALEPAEIFVAAGPVLLRLENVGIRRHNLLILVDGAERASPEVRPGDTVDWSLNSLAPGRYLLWCGEYRHLEKGMAGILVVTEGAEPDG